MSVVNCMVKYIRPQGYSDLKEWMKDENNVYIGRAGIVFIKDINTGKKERWPKQASPFHNPYRVTPLVSREEAVRLYRIHITRLLNTNNDLVELLKSMRGKNLGCWCHPEICHGDVLLELIEQYTA